MALTNIELYEALKKDLNEEAARMIAEVVPPASEILTRDYFERRMAEFETRFERRMTQRILVLLATFVGPLYVALIAEVVKLILK